jgi:hypothetical protein
MKTPNMNDDKAASDAYRALMFIRDRTPTPHPSLPLQRPVDVSGADELDDSQDAEE